MINYSDFELPDRFDPELHHLEALHPSLTDPFLPLPNDHQYSDHSQWHLYFDYNLNPAFVDTLQSSIHLPLDLLPKPQQQQNQAEINQQERKEREQPLGRKNQTKNIPKNFGKGIISFIEKNEKKMRVLLREQGLSFNYFMTSIRAQKKSINTISDLRRLWTHEIFGKSMRIVSNLFFRKHALDYIFNSRIHNYASHIKYRQTLWQALRNPDHFNRIKEF